MSNQIVVSPLRGLEYTAQQKGADIRIILCNSRIIVYIYIYIYIYIYKKPFETF